MSYSLCSNDTPMLNGRDSDAIFSGFSLCIDMTSRFDAMGARAERDAVFENDEAPVSTQPAGASRETPGRHVGSAFRARCERRSVRRLDAQSSQNSPCFRCMKFVRGAQSTLGMQRVNLFSRNFELSRAAESEAIHRCDPAGPGGTVTGATRSAIMGHGCRA